MHPTRGYRGRVAAPRRETNRPNPARTPVSTLRTCPPFPTDRDLRACRPRRPTEGRIHAGRPGSLYEFVQLGLLSDLPRLAQQCVPQGGGIAAVLPRHGENEANLP